MARGLNAVHSGHGYIHNQGIRLEQPNLTDGFPSIGRLAGHGDARLGGNQLYQPLAHHLVIVEVHSRLTKNSLSLLLTSLT
jgi:hypothetical protein